MCPACLATTAMIVAGAASTGGLAALIAKFRARTGAKMFSQKPKSQEKAS